MPIDVLMIDDEQALASATTEYLAAFGLTTHYVTSAEEALDWLTADTAQVVVLDVNLPGMSGFELCRTLRARGDQMPILFLSARQSDDDQILGLSVGGDDFLRKPFPLGVLLAKIRRTLDRVGSTTPPTAFDDGWLVVDPAAGRVWAGGAEVQLKAMEYRLLAYLVANRGRVVTKAELFENVWGDAITGDGTLSVHIRRLRTQIEPNPDQPRYLRTVWGRGYLFEDAP